MAVNFPAPGTRFNRLVLIENLGSDPKRNWLQQWRMVCDCGVETICDASPVKRGKKKSCGCLYREHIASSVRTSPLQHGLTKTPAYKSWTAMKSRCSDPARSRYHGKGIQVCERWLDFKNFIADMGHRPAGTTLDRIDTHGDYEPGNCRWATDKQQHNNKSSNVRLTFNEQSLTYSEWAAATGMTSATLRARLKRGWTVEKTLTTPAP